MLSEKIDEEQSDEDACHSIRIISYVHAAQSLTCDQHSLALQVWDDGCRGRCHGFFTCCFKEVTREYKRRFNSETSAADPY